MNTPLVFDRAAALDRVDGDLVLFRELLTIFAQDLPHQVNSIRQAVLDSSGVGLEAAAHCLKSALGNLGGIEAYTKAAFLEELGRSCFLSGAASALDDLLLAIDRFMAEAQSMGKAD